MIDIKEYKEKANILQVNTLEVISDIFQDYSIENIKTEFSYILGSHGDYEDKEVLEIKIEFEVFPYFFEAFLYFNQIEYHISDDKGKIKAECIVEDFCSFDKMVINYKNYLKKDVLKLISKGNKGW